MSILDTFTILFNSNADQVKKGEEEATAAGKKLAMELDATGEKGASAAHRIEEANGKLAESFDVIKEHAGEMASRLIEHALEVAAAFQALFAVEKLVDNFFETAEQSDQLGERAKSLGVNVEMLDAWGNAAKRVGGSAEAFGASIEHVNTQMSRMELTGKSRILPFFKELGVSAIDPITKKAKSLFDLLPQLARATEGKSKQETAGALRGIGFDEGTIRLLQRGGKELNELLERQKKLGLVTAEDAEIAEKFNIEWDDVKQVFHSITVELDTYFLPVLESVLDLVETVIEFLRDHKDLAVGFFLALGAAAIYAADAFGLLDFALAILTSPITLMIAGITALIAAFAFLYDDLMTFSRGGKSVIGELAKNFSIVGIAANALITIIKDLKETAIETFVGIFNWMRKIPQGFAEWLEIFQYVGQVINAFVQHAISVFEDLIPGIGQVFSDIGDIFSASMPIWAATFSGGFEVIKAIVVAFWDYLKALFTLIAELIVDPEHAFQHFGQTMHSVIDNLISAFPKVTGAFAAVGTAFNAIGEGILNLWHDIESAIVGTIGRVAGAIDRVRLWFGKRTMGADWQPAVNPDGSELGSVAQPKPGAGAGVDWQAWANGSGVPGIPAAQAAIAATQSPIAAQTTASLGAGGNVINNTASIGPTTVTVASGDPNAIAAAVDTHLRNQVSTAINQTMADGVSH